MVRKALKWMFYLCLLAAILPAAGSWASRTVSSWSASQPTPAEARISELADDLDAGELTADDLEAALLEIAELREVKEAEPAPSPPAPTTFAERRDAVGEAIAAANTTESDPTTPVDFAAAKAKAEAAIAEFDVLYGEWIAALEAMQEAHTDEWERQGAGDNVTNATGDRRRGLRDLRLRMTSSLTRDGTPYAEWLKYEGVATAANFSQGLIRDGKSALRCVEPPMGGRLTAEQDRLPRYRLALTPTGE